MSSNYYVGKAFTSLEEYGYSSIHSEKHIIDLAPIGNTVHALNLELSSCRRGLAQENQESFVDGYRPTIRDYIILVA